jgi:hypothetical protein
MFVVLLQRDKEYGVTLAGIHSTEVEALRAAEQWERELPQGGKVKVVLVRDAFPFRQTVIVLGVAFVMLAIVCLAGISVVLAWSLLP